jgi:spore germination protein YaaH
MEEVVNGKFIKITKKAALVLDAKGTEDERTVMPGKVYRLLGEDNDLYKIRFGSKNGYVSKLNAEVIHKESCEKIMIAWDSISSKEKNAEHYSRYINKSCTEQGLDVISPTWFTREGQSDNIESIRVVEKCDREYVTFAHRNGYEVWGLIADFNADRNYAVYTNGKLLDKEIADIVKYALQYDLDGINIDFEGFGSRCKDIYNVYVRTLSEELRKHNIIVSIDVTRESNSDAWGKCYDRKEISKHVDYVCYMAYDENGRLDVVPGSTGSLPWVEDGIVELLNMGISKEKIILGVPFYSRDWKLEKVQPNVKSVIVVEWENISAYIAADETSEKVNIKPADVFAYLDEYNDYFKVLIGEKERYIRKNLCKVLDANEEFYKAVEVIPIMMKDMDSKKENALIEQDNYSKQTKIIYKDIDESLHYIWLEDEKSMEKRIELVKRYDLPGAAAWMLTQETSEIWSVIKELKTMQ